MGILYTFWLRFNQAAIDASLTLMIGLIVAGVFRRMLGSQATRRLFGTGVKGSLRGWCAGMLLPVCSLGVIPVAREMRRSGVPGGVVLAFVLTGPILNPISFLYGLTLGEPKVIITFVAITLLKTALVAYLWERWFGGASDRALAVARASQADLEVLPPPGIKRIASVFATSAKELAGRDIFYFLIGLLGNAILGALIPCGSLQKTMFHHDPMAPLRMLFLSIPAYMSPLSGMVRIGSMFEHGNSIGAAFILLILGIGFCLGTLLWMIRDFGRKIVPWFVMYSLIVLGLGYGCEKLLWDSRKVEADHTHAFDDLASPFYSDRDASPVQMREIVQHKLIDKIGAPEKLAVGSLLTLLFAGLMLRLLDRHGAVDRWLASSPASSGSAWDPRLPPLFLGGISIVGLFVFSVIGAYLFYPNREFCLERMRYLSADTRGMIHDGLVDESIRNLEQWDLVARKLQVGTYLRHFGVTPDQAKSVSDLREAIEMVRDDLRARNIQSARCKLDDIVLRGEYRACRNAYAGLKPLALSY